MDKTPRLRRTIWLAIIFVSVGCLGMFLARPVVGRFRMSAPWVLPAIAVCVLVVLAVVTLILLPRGASRRT
jgi:hypothetical protein